VRSGFFAKTDDPDNQSVLELRDRAGVTVIDPEATAQAATVFLHHPLPFYHGVETRARIKAQKSVLVVHHPPFRGNGSMEYNPVLTQRAIRQQFGLSP
ncbi:MAG: glycosyltransferase family 1 protein, partial [Pseudomonadota bacterium]